MSAYVATFERIGRNHEVPPLNVSGDPDSIAEQVYRYALKFLASRDVWVTVDLEALKGSINANRFGAFTLSEVAS